MVNTCISAARFLVDPVVRPPPWWPAAGYRSSSSLRVIRGDVGVFFDLLSIDEHHRSHVVTLFQWVPVSSLQIDMALLADPLSVTMALFVTGIGFLIHLFAIGTCTVTQILKFFLYLNLFVLSMLMLVFGENLLVTFLGWEGVGACSTS